MIKKIITGLLVLLVIQARAQLLVNFQLPPAGLVAKPQLWTMALTNTTNASMSIHVEMTLTSTYSNQQVMTAVTNTITLAPGTMQLNSSLFTPIQYNVISSDYNIDANPNSLLPVGDFDACFHFFLHTLDNVTEVTEQCEEMYIESLAPPQLVYPYDQTSIDETNPLFTWLPPVPMNLFPNLRYQLNLVAINPLQSAADAMQQNIPVYQQDNLSESELFYPVAAPALEYNKQYAWQIVAKNNDAVVGTTEVWQISLKHFDKATGLKAGDLPYVKLKKELENGYGIFFGALKFEYVNETSDSTWNIRVTDLSDLQKSQWVLNLDSIPLKRGSNLVYSDVGKLDFFKDKHFYLLEVLNSRNETWHLHFQYRKPEEQ